MQIINTLLVALSAVSAVVAAPTPAEGALMVRAPKYYSGPYTNFPGKNTWKGFEELVSKPLMDCSSLRSLELASSRAH